MDNMPDFDSMTPEEMMRWMESLAKKQGATEGLITAGDMEVPDIDPSTVDIDEPGYIPFGMDPEVWAEKKAKEDAERAERIAAMKAADGDKTAPQPVAQTPPPAEEPKPTVEQPAAAASPLDFLADMSGLDASPDTSPIPPVVDEPAPVSYDPSPVLFDTPSDVPELPMEDLFADLSSAVVDTGASEIDWLADLGGASGDLPSFDNLDFGSLEALDQPAAPSGDNALEWLESLVSDGSGAESDSQPVAAAADAMDDMLLSDESDILEDSAVSAVLNDPMEWLADFSETQSVDEAALQAEASREVLEVSDDLDAFFDRIQASNDEEVGLEIDLNAPMGEIANSGLLDFGEVPESTSELDLSEANVGSALTQGADVPPSDVKAWMDSLLDRGIQRTDVTDDDELEDAAPEPSELPDWLVEQVGTPPSTEELLAEADDLPDWLTAPVTDQQNAEFEEMFSQLSSGQPDEAEEDDDDLSLPEFDSQPAPLDTGVIRVQMNDPWVEAFELERDERMSDTGKLAAWYESAAHEFAAARQAEQSQTVPETPAVSVSSSGLKSAQLPPDEELPPGEAQAVPAWLGGADEPEPAPIATPAASVIEPRVSEDEDLPDWLRAAQVESDEIGEVPTWLTDSLSTDEFEILQLGEKPRTTAEQPAQTPALSIQDEPTSPLTVEPAGQSISQQPTSELPKVATPQYTVRQRPMRETIAPHEAGAIINQARASQKMGDVTAMLNAYERLIRAETALDDVEADMEKAAKDAVNKTNPAVLRVYGDVLLRRGKLQQALDTYRAALNLL